MRNLQIQFKALQLPVRSCQPGICSAGWNQWCRWCCPESWEKWKQFEPDWSCDKRWWWSDWWKQSLRHVGNQQGLFAQTQSTVVDSSHLCHKHWHRQQAFVLVCLLQLLVQYKGFPDWIQSELKTCCFSHIIQKFRGRVANTTKKTSFYMPLWHLRRGCLDKEEGRTKPREQWSVWDPNLLYVVQIFLALPPHLSYLVIWDSAIIWYHRYHLQAARFNT